MAKVVLTNAYVVFENVYDFSDHISSISLSTVHDVLDVTPVKDGVIYKEVIAGVGTNTVSLDFYQDFSTGSFNDSVEEFFNSPDSASRVGTKVSCKIRPRNEAISATNPEYRFEALVSEWTPLNAATGQLSTISVTWPISGKITKDITP